MREEGLNASEKAPGRRGGRGCHQIQDQGGTISCIPGRARHRISPCPEGNGEGAGEITRPGGRPRSCCPQWLRVADHLVPIVVQRTKEILESLLLDVLTPPEINPILYKFLDSQVHSLSSPNLAHLHAWWPLNAGGSLDTDLPNHPLTMHTPTPHSLPTAPL